MTGRPRIAAMVFSPPPQFGQRLPHAGDELVHRCLQHFISRGGHQGGDRLTIGAASLSARRTAAA